MVLSLATIVLTGVLYNLNIPLIRLYEGYSWREGLIGRWRTRHYRRQFEALEAQRQGLPAFLKARGSLKDATHETLRAEGLQAIRERNERFPHRRHLVMPTRLGNVVRAFETYPTRQYGMQAITFWPRLAAVVDAKYAAPLDDAKISFDFMLNTSFLSAVLALLTAAAGLVYPIPLAAGGFLIPWLLQTAAFVVLWRLFYEWSIGAAAAWGEMVKGVFDLYRWELLAQLGHKQKVTDKKSERALWRNIEYQILFDDIQDDKGGRPRVAYDDTPAPLPATRATAAPAEIPLVVTRGVGAPLADGALPVLLSVKNNGNAPVKKIVLTDTLPDGFDYRWNSAVAGRGQVEVTGANPYHFRLRGATLPPGQAITLLYVMAARPGRRGSEQP